MARHPQSMPLVSVSSSTSARGLGVSDALSKFCGGLRSEALPLLWLTTAELRLLLLFELASLK